MQDRTRPMTVWPGSGGVSLVVTRGRFRGPELPQVQAERQDLEGVEDENGDKPLVWQDQHGAVDDGIRLEVLNPDTTSPKDAPASASMGVVVEMKQLPGVLHTLLGKSLEECESFVFPPRLLRGGGDMQNVLRVEPQPRELVREVTIEEVITRLDTYRKAAAQYHHDSDAAILEQAVRILRRSS